MIYETFSDWCHHVTDGAFASEIAKKIEIPGPTVSGWIRNNNPSFNGVLKIAIAYKVNPFRAFVETGLMERKHLPETDGIKSLQKISNKELLEELLRREIRHKIKHEMSQEMFVQEIKTQIKQEILSNLKEVFVERKKITNFTTVKEKIF